MENEKHNYAMFSLPRSGSTWLSERFKDFGLTKVDEVLRTTFGTTDSPLYHSNMLTSTDYHDPNFWEGLDIPTKEKLEELKNLNNYENILFKETNSLVQIGFYREILSNYEFIFLQRHLGGVLNSLIKVRDVWRRWSFDYRERILRENLESNLESKEKLSVEDKEVQKCIERCKQKIEDYIAIFERTKGMKIMKNKNNPQILAYLAVQVLEAKDQVDRVIRYEDLATKGIPNDIFDGITGKNRSFETAPASDKYRTHGIRNPSQPYAWVESFSDEDWGAARHILGKYTQDLFPDVSELNLNQNIGEITFVNEANSGEQVSNRHVSCAEFEKFIRRNLIKGIEDKELFRKLAFKPSTTHNFGKSDGCYVSISPEKPITHISPLAALAYAAHLGYTIPSISAYQNLGEKHNAFKINMENTNFGDYSELKRIGEKPQVDAFKDLFGNAAEMALDKNGNFWKIGGSYKDMPEHLKLDNQSPMLWLQRDTETSFRLAIPKKQKKNLDYEKEVLDIIQSNESPEVIKEQLLKLVGLPK